MSPKLKIQLLASLNEYLSFIARNGMNKHYSGGSNINGGQKFLFFLEEARFWTFVSMGYAVVNKPQMVLQKEKT